MNDDQFLLANAYVDGELTADERRVAEADPDVMSEVERLRVVQRELRAVAPPSNEARDAVIGAAMAEFTSGLGTTPDGVTAAPPVDRRRRQSRALAIAAALVAVAGLGVVVSQAGRGDDDALDTADVADVAAVGEAEDRLTESLATDDAGDGGDDADEGDDGGDSDAGESAAVAADAAPQAESVAEDTADFADEMEEADGDDMAADDALDGDADAGGDAAEAGSATAPTLSIPADFDPDAVVEELADLTAIGIFLRIERDAQRLPPSPNTACAGAYEALRRGELDEGDGPRAVLIAIDEQRGLVYAIDETTCGILLEAPVR